MRIATSVFAASALLTRTCNAASAQQQFNGVTAALKLAMYTRRLDVESLLSAGA
jgi:hypothetical protein